MAPFAAWTYQRRTIHDTSQALRTETGAGRFMLTCVMTRRRRAAWAVTSGDQRRHRRICQSHAQGNVKIAERSKRVTMGHRQAGRDTRPVFGCPSPGRAFPIPGILSLCVTTVLVRPTPADRAANYRGGFLPNVAQKFPR